MTTVKTIKGLWKEVLKSGKIVRRKVLQQEQRSSRSFSEFTTEEWTRLRKTNLCSGGALHQSLLMIRSLYV